MKLAAIIVGLLIAVAIAWDASERHYDSCVRDARDEQAEMTKLQRLEERRAGNPLRNHCSRWPF